MIDRRIFASATSLTALLCFVAVPQAWAQSDTENEMTRQQATLCDRLETLSQIEGLGGGLLVEDKDDRPAFAQEGKASVNQACNDDAESITEDRNEDPT